MTVYINDIFPFPLYKGFDEEKYAHDFVEAGTFIMRTLEYYRTIEDSIRKDKDEGEGRLVTSAYRPVLTLDKKTGEVVSKSSEYGPVFFGTGSINPRYIYCFSGPSVDIKYLARRYKYVVRLDNPMLLVSEISTYLSHLNNLPDTMWLDCIQVRYDKDESIDQLPEPASQERLRLSYAQKRRSFSSECEFRLVLTLPLKIEDTPQQLLIQLNKRLENAEIIQT